MATLAASLKWQRDRLSKLWASLLALVLVLGAAVGLVPQPVVAAGNVSLSVSIVANTPTQQSGVPSTFTISYQCSSLDVGASCDNATITVPVPSPGSSTGSQGDSFFSPAVGNVFTAVGPIPAGTSGQITIDVMLQGGVTPNNSTLTLVATFAADGASAQSGPASTNFTAVTNFDVAKSIVGSSAILGAPVTYRVGAFTNDGGVDRVGQYNITTGTLVDTLPTGAVFVSATNGGVYDSLTNTVSWPLPTAANTACPIGVGSLALACQEIVVTYPTGTFGPNDTVTNNLSGTGTTPNGAPVLTDTAQVTHGFSLKNPGAIYDKVTDVQPTVKTEPFPYVHTITNTGNVPIGGQITDYLPCLVSSPPSATPACTTPGYIISQFRFFQYVPSTIDYTTSTGATGTLIPPNAGTFNGASISIPFVLPPGLGIVSYVATYPEIIAVTDFAFLSTDGVLSADFPADTFTQTNCGYFSLVSDGTFGPESRQCAIKPFREAQAQLQVDKSSQSKQAIGPGGVIRWEVNVSNVGETAANIVIDDLLPVELSALVDAANPVWVEIGNGPGDPRNALAIVTVTPNSGGSGRDLIRIEFPAGTLFVFNETIHLEYSTVIRSGAPPTPPKGGPQNCAVATDKLSTATATGCGPFAVSSVAQAAATKTVRGDYDAAFGSPLGYSSAGGTVDWQIVLGNFGNVDLTNYIAYDILPAVGDTGVSAGLSGPRGSDFGTPLSTAVVSSNPALVVSYSQSSNPCRPELIPAGPAGCVNDWTTVFPGAGLAKALRFDFGSTVLAGGQLVTVTYKSDVPAGTPVGDIAWNSVAFKATRADNGSTLLVAEPPKVGVQVTAQRVGDFVWNDLDGDGNQDAGEPGIPDVTVTITGFDINDNSVSFVTVTDANGGYGFDVPPGTYTVTFTTPSGYSASPVGAGGDSTTDSNGTSTTVTVGVSGTDFTLDSGFYLAAHVGNFVWDDLDGDGIQDAGESGIGGVTVTLIGKDGAGNAVTMTTTTAADGSYNFDVAPGSYTVGFGTPAGYTPTTSSSTGSTAANDSNGATVTVTLTSGETNHTLDSGFVRAAHIGDFVWNDVDRDGVQDAGESGIGGVTVTLTGTDVFGNPVTLTTTTDANGIYGFDVAPGTYTVTFVSPTGYTASPIGAGNGNTDSNGPSTNVTVGSGESNNSIDAGFYQLATIEGITWNDTDASGTKSDSEPIIPGAKVELIDPKTGVVVAVTTTDANGHYVFTGLVPSAYTVRFTTPGGMTATTGVIANVNAPANGVGRVDAGFRSAATLPPLPTSPTLTQPTGLLPTTGSNVGDVLLYSGLLLAFGVLLVMATRRRKEVV